MVLNVTLRQTALIKKTMPLDVFTDEKVQYAVRTDGRLITGDFGDGEVILYSPLSYGRGVTVKWSSQERNEISLSLELPTSETEQFIFFQTVMRMLKYWKKSQLYVDGKKTDVLAFAKSAADVKVKSQQQLVMMCDALLHGTDDKPVPICGVRWLLYMGREEATAFLADPARFETWLHVKQTGVYHPEPRFRRTDDGVEGAFVCSAGFISVFPESPEAPADLIDTDTGMRVDVHRWRIMLYIPDADKFIGDIGYDEFMARIGPTQKRRFDGAHCQVGPLTESDLRALMNGPLDV